MNENTQHNNKLTVSTAADLLAYVPTTLGFQPRESFVVMTMRGQQNGLTLRSNTPAEAVRPVDYAQAMMRHLLADTAADGALLFVYTNEVADAALLGENEHAKPYMEYAKALEAEMERAGWSLRNGWLVTDKGWTTYFCEDGGCCTLNPLDEVRDSAVNAEMIYRGYSTRPSAEATAVDPAFIGSDDAHATITEATYWINRLGAPDDLEFDHQKMCDARAEWNEALGEDIDERAACELVCYLNIKSIRERLMADAIGAADDEPTFQKVLIGQYEGRPDWSRVEATEDLLIKILAYTPIEDRAALFCFLGWLSWYRGSSSVAIAYFTKALDIDGQHRLSRLLRELVSRSYVPLAAQNEATAYPQGNRH
ncbi:DUF4192 domain-containing protein [Arthrobacter sp. TMS1-12-1]